MAVKVQVRVTQMCAERLRGGHMWVYRNEIAHMDPGCQDGGLVRVSDPKGHFLATGYLNTRSSIPVRILSFAEKELDHDFIAERIEKALSQRLNWGYSRVGSFRVVHSEGDFLPGLIIDKYEDSAVFQLLTLWMERQRDTVISTITEVLNPRILVERSDVSVREKEGLPLRKAILTGNNPRKIISLDGLNFEIDLLEGQKTGFYLDVQRIRQDLGPYVKERNVLDCFSYSGAFSVYAIQAGARHVLAVEETTLGADFLNKNIELNGCRGKIEALKADAFEILREHTRNKRKYGCVILDPPSFAKSVREKAGALKGYREIALRGIMLLEEGGCLIMTSCSQHISLKDLKESVRMAQKDAGAYLKVLDIQGQAPDHPVLLGHPETEYLTCLILERRRV